MTAARRRAIPPLPRLRDWVWAGLCAGALLGIAEVGAWRLEGLDPSPALVGVLVAGAAAIVGALSAALGLGVAVFGVRPRPSTQAGAIVGPMLLAPAVGPLAEALRTDPTPAVWLALGLALALATLAGGTAALAARALERAGEPVSGWPLWIPTALLVAAGERAAHVGGTREWVLAGAAIALLAAICVGAVIAARRWSFGPPRTGGAGLLAVALAAAALAWGPSVWPWLLLEPDLPEIARAPASLLVLEIPPPGPTETADAAVWLGLAADGVLYERVSLGRDAELLLPGREPLATALYHGGYARGAVARDPRLPRHTGFPDRDAAVAASSLLARRGAATSAGRVLLGLGPEARDRLGLGDPLCTPDAVAGAARRWLVDWRRRRAHVPFVLRVDFVSREGATDAASVDHAVDRVLDLLRDLAVDDNTFVLGLRTRVRPGAVEPDLSEVVVRPPYVLGGEGRGQRVPRRVSGPSLTLALQEGLGSETRLALPGVTPIFTEEFPVMLDLDLSGDEGEPGEQDASDWIVP